MADSSNWDDIVCDEYSSDNLKPEITSKSHITDFSLTYPQSGLQLNFQSDTNTNKSSYWSHKRSQSYDDTESFQEIESFDQDTTKLLPIFMKKIIYEKPVLINIEIYDKLLSENNEEAAENILKIIIRNAKDYNEQSSIYRSAADANKRHLFNKIALEMYKRAEEVDPQCVQNYIDHAKLLDEIGETDETEKILRIGLEKTMMSEQITVKLLKQYERRQQYSEARSVFGYIYSKGRLNMTTISSIIEGILFEVKHGNIIKALLVFDKILTETNVKSSVFVDLVDTMRKRGYLNMALKYAQDGVKRFPNMPNNWISLLQLQSSKLDVQNILTKYQKHLSVNSISKIEQTASFLFAKNNSIKECRNLLSECIAKSAPDQRWRLYYNAAIIEMNYGASSIIPRLLQSADAITPSRSKSFIRLSIAKISEVNNKINKALEVYDSLSKSVNNDWRTYLEFAMFFIRQHQTEKALECTKEGLKMHSNNGRLWALRIQLEDESSKISALEEGVRNAPKSGEVWTEAARIALNPLSKYFNLKSARFYLNTAFLFTPQYIDIFIEMIRLEILENGFEANLDKIREMYIGGDGNYGTVIYMFRRLGSEFTSIEFDEIVKGVKEDIRKHSKIYSRAIARSSFVFESTSNEEEKIKHDQALLHPSSFSFGLSSFFDVIKDDGVMSTAKSSVIFGVSGSLL